MLAATFLFAACSADEPSEPDSVEPDFEGIVLNISRPYTDTRADGTISITSDEGKISSLTILAFPQSGSDKTPIVTHIGDNQTLSDETWTHVRVRLSHNNTYKIYVMANVNKDNLYKGSSKLTTGDFVTALKGLEEDDMEDLNISAAPFGALSSTSTDANGNEVTTTLHTIPMSCNQSAVKWRVKGGEMQTGGAITIKQKESTTVNATLIFAMAKVEYTFYNGKASFLKMADNAADRLKFDNYATRVGLIDHYSGTTPLSGTSETGVASAGDNGTFYKATTTNYPDTPEKNEDGEITKKAGPTDAQIKADLVATNILPNNTDANHNAWIYHGTAYVPEYLFAEGTAATSQTHLKFTFKPKPGSGATQTQVDAYSNKTYLSFGGNDIIDNPLNPGSAAGGAATHHGVIRGVIYDVLIYTTEKEIALKVRVKPWAYSRYDFEL